MRLSEDKYSDFYENTPIALFSVGMDGRIRLCNRQAVELLGYEKQDLTGKSLLDLCAKTPHGQKKAEQIFEKLKKGQSIQGEELQMQKADGAFLWVDLSVNPVRDQNGDVVESCSSMVDISHRFQSEDKVKRLNHVLKSICNLNQYMVREKDRDRLLQGVCERLILEQGYFNAWIVLWSKSGKIEAAAETGLGDDFLLLIDRLKQGEFPDCVRRALDKPEIVFTKDPFSTCKKCPLSKHYRNRSGYTVRLEHMGRIYGVLCVSVPPHYSQDKNELLFLKETTRDLSFALYHLEIWEENKRARFELLDRERVLNVTGKMGKIGGWEHDLKTGKAIWTKALYDIIKIPYDQDPPGMNEHLDFYPEKDRKILEKAYNAAVSEGTPFDLILRVYTKEKNLLWCRAQGEPVFQDGECVIMRGVFQDVTELKQSQEELRKSNETLASILDNIGIGVSLISSQMEILELNQQMRKWFPNINVKDKPICFQAFNDPPRDGVCDYCPTCETLKDGQIHEAATSTPQGETIRNYRIISSPIRDADGNVIAAVEMVEDITERKFLEQKLQQAQKLESIGLLAGGVAHDFNNMLSVILGYGVMLRDGIYESDPMREYVEEIVKAAEHSAELTHQLLAFSRKQTLQPKVLSINSILEKIVNMIQRIIGEDIELKLHLADDLFNVEVDPGQLQQVVMNIAVNARDAMPQGGKLTIETANVELDEAYAKEHLAVTPGEYVLLAITDNGCGMDQETLKNVFDPFFTTKGKEKGTGLGLSTIYGIIKQSGGNIWIYSELDEGTTVKIYLPRVRAEEAPESRGSQDNSVSCEGVSVLVVEDQPSVRKLIGMMLEDMACRPTLTANGEEALKAVLEKGLSPDLLITDVVMPGMNGKVLADRLKKIIPDLPVLYMSGFTDNAIVHHGVLDPGTPFLHKPAKMTKFKAVVSAMIGEYRMKK